MDVCTCEGACGGFRSPQLESPLVVTSETRVLGTDLGSSARAAQLLAAEPCPWPPSFEHL